MYPKQSIINVDREETWEKCPEKEPPWRDNEDLRTEEKLLNVKKKM